MDIDSHDTKLTFIRCHSLVLGSLGGVEGQHFGPKVTPLHYSASKQSCMYHQQCFSPRRGYRKHVNHTKLKSVTLPLLLHRSHHRQSKTQTYMKDRENIMQYNYFTRGKCQNYVTEVTPSHNTVATSNNSTGTLYTVS